MEKKKGRSISSEMFGSRTATTNFNAKVAENRGGGPRRTNGGATGQVWSLGVGVWDKKEASTIMSKVLKLGS